MMKQPHIWMGRAVVVGALTAFCVCSHPLSAQESAQESAYYELAERFEQRDKTLQKDLKPYLQKYPYTTYEDEIHFFGGVMQAEKGKWKQAAKELEQVDHKALTRPHQTEYQFYRGYTYLMLQEYARASTYFALLRKTDNDYTTKATYYYAYCQYKQQHYDKALPALLSLEGKSEYAKTVPYYIVQIYYAQGENAEVEARAEQLLASQPDNENSSELHRMLGEIYYQKATDSKDTKSKTQCLQQAVTHLRRIVRRLNQARCRWCATICIYWGSPIICSAPTAIPTGSPKPLRRSNR